MNSQQDNASLKEQLDVANEIIHRQNVQIVTLHNQLMQARYVQYVSERNRFIRSFSRCSSQACFGNRT